MRIAIVSDLESVRNLLRHVVRSQHGWQVAWETSKGEQAINLCAQDTPHLILIDPLMSGMNGVEVIRSIMKSHPCPVLVVMSGGQNNISLAFDALAAGALDAVACPASLQPSDQSGLLAKILMIARLIGRSRRTAREQDRTARASIDQSTLVVIGSSAGGPAALRILLAELPETFPAPLVIAQHIDEKFADGMAGWLSSASRLPVAIAQQGDRPQAGHVLLASTNHHLILLERGQLVYTEEPLDQPYRPSVDELFASAALHWPGPIVGVLLTGMGHDGARGLLALRRLGHYTFAQDQQSAAVYGMPGTAVQFGAAMMQMNPAAIGRELVRMAGTR